MSRVHFKVVTDSVGCYVEDLESSNGTFLNGEKVISERLKHGDRIRAGRTTFMVQIEGDNPDLTGSYVGTMPRGRGVARQPSGKDRFCTNARSANRNCFNIRWPSRTCRRHPWRSN